MTDNYFKMLNGQYIRNYLNYYFTLENIDVIPYNCGYEIKAVTKLNDFNIIVYIDDNNYKIEELCDTAFSKIKTEILKHYITPHL
mgnify:CR=1 FL=1